MPVPREGELAECRRGAARELDALPENIHSRERGEDRGGEKGGAPLRPRVGRLDLDSGPAREIRDVVAKIGELTGQIFGRGVAALGLLGHTPLDYPAQGSGRLGRDSPDRFGIVFDDRRQRLGCRRSFEGRKTRRHLVEHRAQRELVRPEVHRMPGGLLGRHVGHRPHGDPGPCRSRNGFSGRRLSAVFERMGQLGQPEVQDLDDPVRRHHDVLGLQVPMDDAGGVSTGEPFGDLRGDREDLAKGERCAGRELPERLSFDELHRDERRRIDPGDLEDRDDVGVGEGGGGTGLALEPPEALGIRGELFREDLDRDLAGEPRIPRPPDLSHPARAERGQDLVRAESRSGLECHSVARRILVRRPAAPCHCSRVVSVVAGRVARRQLSDTEPNRISSRSESATAFRILRPPEKFRSFQVGPRMVLRRWAPPTATFAD